MTDKWSGFADLLANLIEKYAAVLDVDNLPEPPKYFEEKISAEKSIDPIEKRKSPNIIIVKMMSKLRVKKIFAWST